MFGRQTRSVTKNRRKKRISKAKQKSDAISGGVSNAVLVLLLRLKDKLMEGGNCYGELIFYGKCRDIRIAT